MTDNAALATQARAAEGFLAGSSPAPAAKPARPARPASVAAATSFLLPMCDCPSPPWEACEHTGHGR